MVNFLRKMFHFNYISTNEIASFKFPPKISQILFLYYLPLYSYFFFVIYISKYKTFVSRSRILATTQMKSFMTEVIINYMLYAINDSKCRLVCVSMLLGYHHPTVLQAFVTVTNYVTF